MQNKITLLSSMAERYNQKSKDSILWREIQFVFDCSERKAKRLAKTYCNCISFYMCLFASDLIDISFSEYLEIGYNQKVFFGGKWRNHNITEKGYIYDKEKLCKKLGVDFDLFIIRDYSFFIDPEGWQLNQNSIYQVRIKTGFWSKHFMSCLIDDGEFKVFDTWGGKKVTDKNFEALIEV